MLIIICSLLVDSIFKSYDQLYLEYCENTGVKPNLVSNERGLKGFWLGSPTAKYVVINFHGKHSSGAPDRMLRAV